MQKILELHSVTTPHTHPSGDMHGPTPACEITVVSVVEPAPPKTQQLNDAQLLGLLAFTILGVLFVLWRCDVADSTPRYR